MSAQHAPTARFFADSLLLIGSVELMIAPAAAFAVTAFLMNTLLKSGSLWLGVLFFAACVVLMVFPALLLIASGRLMKRHINAEPQGVWVLEPAPTALEGDNLLLLPIPMQPVVTAA